MKTKVIQILKDKYILFDNGTKLMSEHENNCCESHYLSFNDLTLDDFKGLEFDLSDESFFTRVPDYGIRLNPIKGLSVNIPGYGFNNGYYSSQLDLVLIDKDGKNTTFNISECQVIEG